MNSEGDVHGYVFVERPHIVERLAAAEEAELPRVHAEGVPDGGPQRRRPRLRADGVRVRVWEPDAEGPRAPIRLRGWLGFRLRLRHVDLRVDGELAQLRCRDVLRRSLPCGGALCNLRRSICKLATQNG